MVIDLSDVTYIDSAGLAPLFRPCKRWKPTRKIFAGRLQDTVRSIFEISRLDQVFQIFPDTDAALATT